MHAFDPTSRLRAAHERHRFPGVTFHYSGLGAKAGGTAATSAAPGYGALGGPVRALDELLAMNGHKHRSLSLVKIDCEGCEWSTVRDWIGVGARQILVETHGLPSPQGTPRARWYQKPLNLTEYFGMYRDNGYVLFSKERNGKWAAELGFMKMADDFWRAP